MALTITKKKSATSKKQQVQDDVDERVDRLADINAQLAYVEPLVKEKAAILKEFSELADAKPSGEVIRFTGTKHVLEFSERSMSRSIIDMMALRKKLGNELFMEIAKVTLTDMDKYVSKIESAAFVAEARTGSRRQKLVEVKAD